MENKERTMVEMTPEEKAQYEAFKEAQAKKEAQERKKQQRDDLQKLTDEVLDEAVADLEACSASLKECKEKVMDTFWALMEMRKEVNTEAGKKEQDTYMFTNSAGTMRVRIGYNMLDNYADSVEEGIAKVHAYIKSLAKDDESKVLVDTILRLLSRDQAGNLKASRVMQLWKMAQDSKSEEFMEGMKIIQESYRPTRSKLFVRCAVKRTKDNGECEWKEVPLSITEV